MKKYIIILILGLMSTGISAQVLSLDSCKRLTLKNNRKVIEARLEVDRADQVKKDAFTHYFPDISAGAVAMKANDYLIQEKIPSANLPVYDGNPANIPLATEFAYFPGMDLNLFDYANIGYVNAIQPVFMGGQVRTGNKLASVGQEVSQHQLILSEEEALLKTEEQYWTLVSFIEKMETIESYSQLLDTLHLQVEVSYEAGLVQKTDYLKVKLEQNKLQAKKLQLENGIELVRMALCQNMGIAYSPELDFVEETTEIQPSGVHLVDADTAYKNRQEYLLLQNAIDAEKLGIRMELGKALPQLGVGVSGLYLDMLDDQSTALLGVATLHIPITGWWGGSHKMKEHQLKVEMAENRLAESVELFQLQMNKSLNELTESYEQVSIAEITLEQVNEHLKVMHDNYDAGLVSTSDMLEAQAMYQEAEDALSDAQCTYQIKLAHYKKAVSNTDRESFVMAN